MRFLTRFGLLIALLVCWGCFPKRQTTVVLPAEVPVLEQETNAIGLEREAELIAAKILDSEWLRSQRTMPVMLLGTLEQHPEPKVRDAYLDVLGKRLLESGKLILVQPREAQSHPALPMQTALADSLAGSSGARWFGQSLQDGPTGSRRLVLRIYRLPELQLVESVSCEIDKN